MRYVMAFETHRSMLRNVLMMTVVLGVAAISGRVIAQPTPEVKPGPEHEQLKESEGTWDCLIKSNGEETKGTMTYKMALNGLWLLEEFRGEVTGSQFEGRGATSFDPSKKKFVNVWVDSMSTRPIVSEGTYDKATKTMTMHGEMPLPDGSSMKVKFATVTKDADTKVFTITTTGEGNQEIEMLQITYKRRAK